MKQIKRMTQEEKQIIDNFVEGESLDKSREEVAGWIQSEPQRVEYYSRVMNMDAILGERTNISERRINELYTGLDIQKKEIRYRGVRALKIALCAACVTIVGLIGLFLMDVKGYVDSRLTVDKLYANQVSTHCGETKIVELPDGTKVKLNSNSSLAYADDFEGFDTRMVALEGEGFFEVEKNTERPFVVNAGGMQVKVLGTKFNVNSYLNRSIKTTLLEGRVEVNNNKGELVAQLNPGDELVYDNNRKQLLSLQSIDAKESTSWRNGYVKCREMKMQELGLILENAYGVDIQFVGENASEVEVSGRIYFDMPIEELILVLEKTYALDITLNKSDDYRAILMIKK